MGDLHVQKLPWAHISAEHNLCLAMNEVNRVPLRFVGRSSPYGPIGLISSLPSSSSSSALLIPTDPLMSAPMIGMRPSCLHPSRIFFSSSSSTSSYCYAEYDDVGIYKEMTRYCSVLPLEPFQFRSSDINRAVPDSSVDPIGSGDPASFQANAALRLSMMPTPP